MSARRIRSILCLGAALVDRTYRLRGRPLEGTSIPAQMSLGFGGVARNVAANLARLGVPVRLASAVGADAPGDALRADLAALGVDVEGVRRVVGAATAEYAQMLTEGGDLVVAAAAVDHLEDALAALAVAAARAASADDILFAEANLPAAALAEITVEARRRGLMLALDAVSAPKATRLPADLSGVALAAMNAAEARVCLGSAGAPKELAAALVARGAAAAIVTDGARGAFGADGDGAFHVRAPTTSVVDASGAGDSLLAAVLWRIALGEGVRTALPWGVAAAAATVACAGRVLPQLSPAFLAARRGAMADA